MLATFKIAPQFWIGMGVVGIIVIAMIAVFWGMAYNKTKE